VTPDPEGPEPFPDSAPASIKTGAAIPPAALPRAILAMSLFDAEAPEMKLGNGHARYGLRDDLYRAVVLKDEAWLDHAVTRWIKPQYRAAISGRLTRIYDSALRPVRPPGPDPEIRKLAGQLLIIAQGQLRDDHDPLLAIGMADALLRAAEPGRQDAGPDLDDVRRYIEDESWEGMPGA
jgi:hypothetical protein